MPGRTFSQNQYQQPGSVSLEYFPPKGLSAERALQTAAHALRRFSPAFQTVTFGAGGSAIEGSLDWPSRLQNLNDIPTAAHITLCQFASRDAFLDHAERLWQLGIKRLVVLRGDAEGSSDGLGEFESVAAAVASLKAMAPFDISVAAYPEIHPLAKDLNADIDVLLEKQEAGADRAVTQFFFDNEAFYGFRDRAAARGLTIDLVPGIMPIKDFAKVARFADQCGAKVSSNMRERFAACGDDRAKQTAVARDLVERQVVDLAANEVDSIHVYTLNRIDLTADAVRAFQGCFIQPEEAAEPLKLIA